MSLAPCSVCQCSLMTIWLKGLDDVGKRLGVTCFSYLRNWFPSFWRCPHGGSGTLGLKPCNPPSSPLLDTTQYKIYTRKKKALLLKNDITDPESFSRYTPQWIFYRVGSLPPFMSISCHFRPQGYFKALIFFLQKEELIWVLLLVYRYFTQKALWEMWLLPKRKK